MAADDPDVQLERLEQLREHHLARDLQREPWEPSPHQIAPDGDWYLWLLLAGRGSGKTDACSSYFDRFMRQNPGARGGIIAPTLGDAAEACVFGASGLLMHNPMIRVRNRIGGTFVFWPNGSEAKLFGANTPSDVDRLRAGGNRHLYWGEEVAAWRYLKEAWENAELGLRLGENPHWVASTTPKPRPFLKGLMGDATTELRRATMSDNKHLPEVQRQRLIARYKGTRLYRQEILGEYLEDVEGALWTYEMLQRSRVKPEEVPDLVRVVEGVDPSGGDEDGNDEQGIVVAGRGVNDHLYIIADLSCKETPNGWARRAVQGYVDHKGDKIVGEANFGGDMVIHTIRTAARDMRVEVNVGKVQASRGKAVRAEPISSLWEQGRGHIVGELPELESQMRNWTPESGWSPDRMDGMVWAASDLMLGDKGPIRMRTGVARKRIPTAADRFATPTV